MEVKPFEMKIGDFTVLAEYMPKKGSNSFPFSAFVELFSLVSLGSFVGPSLFVLGHTSSRKRSIKTQLSGQDEVDRSIPKCCRNHVEYFILV
jgi:hypothetical protein